MRNLTQNAVTENTIRDMAQEQFFIEDKLERDFALGFISDCVALLMRPKGRNRN